MRTFYQEIIYKPFIIVRFEGRDQLLTSIGLKHKLDFFTNNYYLLFFKVIKFGFSQWIVVNVVLIY